MYYLKVNNFTCPAEFTGKMIDREWDDRASKTITVSEDYATITAVLHDDAPWHIYRSWIEQRPKIDPETGEPMIDPETGEIIMEDVTVEEDFDNSEFSVRGDVIVHPDTTVSVKMGKPTDLEIAYELLYG